VPLKVSVFRRNSGPLKRSPLRLIITSPSACESPVDESYCRRRARITLLWRRSSALPSIVVVDSVWPSMRSPLTKVGASSVAAGSSRSAS